jgi:voltage-gated potassium channel
MGHHLNSNKPSILSQIRAFATRHLIVTALTILVLSWLTISYLVFRVEYRVTGSNITSYAEGLWWGIVTFLTVGYGDRYPITQEGRVLGGVLMLSGVLSIALITSKISSYFLEQVLREGRGFVDSSKLRDHFVICGWKEDMQDLLTHILDFNPGLTSDQIVLVAPLPQSEIDALHAIPRLSSLHVIIGDYYQVAVLKRAVPERARKVMILADRTPNVAGHVPTVTEVDARTVMTAMTLANIAKGTLVTAEILDPKMDQYLKIAQVSEIIYSREYSRLLLGNAAGGTGISNILFDLLDPNTDTYLTTLPIPSDLIGRTYAELREQIETGSTRQILLGILENTGNSHTIKELALRQAQKTPDMEKLVMNLKTVKHLKCNHPVFNPPPSTLLHEGSMAMVIGKRKGRGVQHVQSEEEVSRTAA